MTVFPDYNKEPIKFVDMSPTDDLPLRILEAYREDCDLKWGGDDGVLSIFMNRLQDDRAKILDKAIRILKNNL